MATKSKSKTTTKQPRQRSMVTYILSYLLLITMFIVTAVKYFSDTNNLSAQLTEVRDSLHTAKPDTVNRFMLPPSDSSVFSKLVISDSVHALGYLQLNRDSTIEVHITAANKQQAVDTLFRGYHLAKQAIPPYD